jgi:hypothetical protein
MNMVPEQLRKLHCKSESGIGKHASSCLGVLRPVLGSVVNAGDFHYLILNPIDDNVRQSWKDKLPGAVDPALATAMRKAAQAVAAVINRLRHVSSGIGIAECTRQLCRDRWRRGWSSVSALTLQDLLQLRTYVLMLHEISAIRGRQANIDGLDEVPVIFQVAAQNLLR